jgi:hypothetical protein
MIDGVHLLLTVTNDILASIFGMLDCNRNNGTNGCCKYFKDDKTLEERVCQGSPLKSIWPTKRNDLFHNRHGQLANLSK